MKNLLFTSLLLGLLTMSCKDTSVSDVAKVTKEEVVKEVPRKLVQEQYSSPDNMVKESIDTASVTQAVENLNIDTKVATVEKKEKILTPVPKPKKKVAKAPVRTADIKFDDYILDFGEIMQGDKVDHKFTFTNTGNAPLSITKADVTCGCTTPSIPFMDIMPGEQGYIGVTYNSVGKEGEESPQITISTNSLTTPNLVLKMKGIVKVPEEEPEPTTPDSLNTTPQDSTRSN